MCAPEMRCGDWWQPHSIDQSWSGFFSFFSVLYLFIFRVSFEQQFSGFLCGSEVDRVPDEWEAPRGLPAGPSSSVDAEWSVWLNPRLIPVFAQFSFCFPAAFRRIVTSVADKSHSTGFIDSRLALVSRCVRLLNPNGNRLEWRRLWACRSNWIR